MPDKRPNKVCVLPVPGGPYNKHIPFSYVTISVIELI